MSCKIIQKGLKYSLKYSKKPTWMMSSMFVEEEKGSTQYSSSSKVDPFDM